MPANNTIRIRFTKDATPYRKGDVVTLSERYATRFIDAKVAEPARDRKPSNKVAKVGVSK